MGHGKLRKFAENETFGCLLQPSSEEVLADGFLALRNHPVKGHWNEMMFDKPRPIVLELGCGKGEYTIDLALRNPDFNYIGVDIKGARLWKGAKYAHEHKLGNVAFLRTRIEFITAFFAPGEVSEVWLTFSDPQLKSENSRLTSPLFLERYRSFLRTGGVVHLKTDSQFLHQYTLATVSANSLRLLASTDDLYGSDRISLPADAFRVDTAGACNSGTVSADLAVDGGAVSANLAVGGDAVSACPVVDGATVLAGLDSAAGTVPAGPAVDGGRRLASEEALRDRIAALYEVQTFYERMFLQKGLKITYLSFCIDHDGAYRHPLDPAEFDSAYWREVEGPRRSFDHQPPKGSIPE